MSGTDTESTHFLHWAALSTSSNDSEHNEDGLLFGCPDAACCCCCCVDIRKPSSAFNCRQVVSLSESGVSFVTANGNLSAINNSTRHHSERTIFG